ncbi:MAG: RNA methyltransferase [Treponema sp.]|jgi:TrmH RNA methyltransferase|nr:RNA methyltransferase [Treponema sp.]
MRNKLTKELAICGLNAVAARGKYHPETISRFFLREDRLTAFSGICKDLAERKRPYKLCEDEELERISKTSRHQGVVAMIEEPEVKPLEEEELIRWAREGKTGLLLHSVGNDHNLGAMVRSAAFFEAAFVIISEADAEARLTTSAYRVAEGGMEHVIFRRIRDSAKFLQAASRVIITIGADPRARWRIRDLDTIIKGWRTPRENGRPGIALVVGNEETGLPREVQEQCTALVRIPGTGLVECLNVAQAATLFLHHVYEL